MPISFGVFYCAIVNKWTVKLIKRLKVNLDGRHILVNIKYTILSLPVPCLPVKSHVLPLYSKFPDPGLYV